MTTAIIGAGGLGSAIARQLAAGGGDPAPVPSADSRSRRERWLRRSVGAVRSPRADNQRRALQGADAVVLALRSAPS